jgi:succinoglycan biosynthesis protein ExoO
MVGNLYEPNVIGMNDFIEHVWPAVHEALPATRLLICGKMGRKAPKHVPGVHVEGLVPSLEPYYARAAVVINPVPYGTGLKIKTVEALCLGKAVVATPAGARGLGEDCTALRVCALGKPMAKAVIALLRNPEDRRALEGAALTFARDRFAPEHAYAALLDRLRAHASQRENDR